MTEPIYKDELFTVTQVDKYYISTIPNFPPSLRKYFLSYGELCHSSMADFEAYRDKFKAILNHLETQSDEAFHIACFYHKPIENSCFDINFKKTSEELADKLLLRYKDKKEEAIKQIAYFINNKNEINYKEEEERDKLILRYNLVPMYENNMGYRSDKMLDEISKSLDVLKEILYKNGTIKK